MAHSHGFLDGVIEGYSKSKTIASIFDTGYFHYVSPLVLSLRNSNFDIFKDLLARGFHVCLRDFKDSDFTNTDFIVHLINCLHDNINITNDSEETLLIIAVRLKHDEIVKCLLGTKIDINASDKEKNTALHIASKDQPEIAKLLLKYGADPRALNKKEKSCFSIALDNNLNEKYLQYFIKAGASVDEVDTNGCSILSRHVEACNVSIIKFLLKSKANVNCVDNKGESPLMKAILSNNPSIAGLLIDNGADVNACCGTRNQTVLRLAVEMNSVEIVNNLLRSGCKMETCHKQTLESEEDYYNSYYEDNLPLLMVAIDHGNSALIKLLLEAGADVNYSDDDLEPALIRAVSIEHIDSFCNAKNNSNRKRLTNVNPLYEPFFVANNICNCRSENTHKILAEMIDALLQHGANVNSVDFSESTALHIAVEKDNKDAISVLLRHSAAVDVRNSQGRTALMLAARLKLETIVSLLLEAKSSLTVTDFSERTALMIAVESGAENIVALLLNAGADVWAVDDCSYTSLHIAAEFPNTNIMRMILDYCNRSQKNTKHIDLFFPKTKLNDNPQNHLVAEKITVQDTRVNTFAQKKNNFDETAFIIACRYNQVDNMRLLLNFGTDINEINRYGDTPLLSALDYMSEDAVEILLENSADLTKINNKGMSALHYAAKCKSTSIFYRILMSGLDVNKQSDIGETPLFFCNKKEYSQQLIDGGANVHHKNKEGMTALHYAVRKNNMEVVKLLLHYGIEVNIISQRRETPLFIAVTNKNFEMAELLVTSGADVNIKGLDGNTPLLYSAKFPVSKSNPPTSMSCTKYKKEIFKLLISNGASINEQNNDGETALMLSLGRNDKFWFEKLIQLRPNLDLTDCENRSVLIRALEIDTNYKKPSYIKTFLNMGINPVVNESHRESVLNTCYFCNKPNKYSYCIYNLIKSKKNEFLRFFFCNGAVPVASSKNQDDVSFISLAISERNYDCIKYFFAIGFINNADLVFINKLYPRTTSSYSSNLNNNEIHAILELASQQPWPLVKLAFIAVSTLLGYGPEREVKLQETKLPPALKRMLMFQVKASTLPVAEWGNIPLCFDPDQYEKLPNPRPLIHYWPIGQKLC
ncbi:putative ankyrin repeat protein RF_0381 [Physella acuta]|uniref:putative ankyrin repeat protein RF_0381 n=1 Tax=Physella acuta TaxID=109671 RepID=UPI0027DE88AE|nr:putative ankyrin repeat protein RF_0381 [Physella acuta]